MLRFVPEVKFGVGTSSEVGYDIKKFSARSVLLITDKILHTKTPFIEQIINDIRKTGIEEIDIWDGVEPEPSEETIKAAIKFAKQKKYDLYIAIGGGSVIDTAKFVRLYTTYPTEDLRDYFMPPYGRGKPIPGPLKPMIAIPTTAGTGAEISAVAVVTLSKEREKYGLVSKYLVPSLIVLDPLLTITAPPKVTADSGMDALMNAIESYTAKSFNMRERPANPLVRPIYQGSSPLTDFLAEKAIELIGRYLPKAYANGFDLEARSNMLLAAHLAGIAAANAGVHIPHALGYAIAHIGMEKDLKLTHGLTVALAAPATFKVIAPYIADKCLKIAYILRNYIPEKTIEPKSAAIAIANLMNILDMPSGLAELGFTEKDIEKLIELTLKQKRLLAQSPITPTHKLLSKIVKLSLKY